MHPETLRLLDITHRQIDGLSVLSARVYDLNGIVIFSTNLDEIGLDESEKPAFLMARSGDVMSYYIDSEDPSQPKEVVASYMPIQPNGAGTPIEGVFQIFDDVTPLVEQIAMREEAKARCQQTEKEHMQLLQQHQIAELRKGFMMAMSHDFRNPLSSINLSSQFLKNIGSD